ncbi:protein BANP-like isoform X1 [Ischnura elegans]|uniref:protein BANP-like isoform X1 n=1 Tax=Ischnura elegans TaxID=197161 RepID=UPI001ED8A293|nr:protein BANP-like isoform X1 [Ischnura elegans]XP_046387623.1 protein BANP-like isoform X1 [Ischnura elegans]
MEEREFKRFKSNNSQSTAMEDCSKQIIDFKHTFSQQISNLVNRMSQITTCCNTVLQRIDVIENLVKNNVKCDNHRHPCCDDIIRRIQVLEDFIKSESLIIKSDALSQSGNIKDLHGTTGGIGSPVVIVRNSKPPQVSASVTLDSSMQVITLNSEADYPEGSWLGDESNPECRVRSPITPADLLHINTFCHTPEKMALTLLDYLFPREVLAVSNLSGKGKHGKKQLDPLMIYGVQCHLLHKFHINDRDWYRIKQNMDSKCRTAWRKKLKGLPLGGFKNSSSHENQIHKVISEDGESLIVTPGSLVGDTIVEEIDAQAFQVIHTPQGDIKVLHATPEQIVRIQEGHHIQVFTGDQILPVLQEHAQILSTEGNEGSVSCSEETSTEISLGVVGGEQATLAIVADASEEEESGVSGTIGAEELDEAINQHNERCSTMEVTRILSGSRRNRNVVHLVEEGMVEDDTGGLNGQLILGE